MAKNEYARILKEKKERERQLAAELNQRWTAQLCLDVMTLVLNDPDVMGHDVFGKERLERIGNAFNEQYGKYVAGISEDVSASYVRDKLDERLVRIWGDDLARWPERYYLWIDKGI